MSRIAILSSAVADQIAAGEVVERPASVVKELVENALDAGATTVDVTIEEGGRALIRIADDGTGMDRDDAVLCLARHATSKITAAEELVGVRSFGFRGEALPAIASVSEVMIETATEDGAGTQVRAAAGAVLETRDATRRRGTTVSVQRLFYNTPARQKFLRSARSEWRGIVDTMHAISALRRDVHFTVRHDGKLALDLPAVPTLRARLAVLWGHGDVQRFIDLDDVQGPIHITGMVERPADVGTATRRVLLIINGRVVRDHGIVRAAEAAYRSTLPSGVRPSLVLSLHVPGGDVDVNVHPAKTEVRLRDRWPTERAVENAVRRALGVFDASAGIGWRTWTPAATPSWRQDVHAMDPSALRATPAAEGLFAPTSVNTNVITDANTVRQDAVATTAPNDRTDHARHVDDAPISVPPLLQLRRMYLMFEHDDGVILIDQHSAHERVLYEDFLGVLERGEAPSQRLLFPMTLHLGPDEAEAFEANRASFEKLGFEMEGFGGHSLLVNAVPMPHPRFDAERCLRETLAALTGDRAAGDAKRHERLAATFACKAAIKAGDVMSPGEMRALYIALANTKLPAHDVHGRSTIVRLSWDELDRRFGRK
ncbi:DNA mismatch repair endonuclease MutL [Gemmatimonas sp.]|uniref:DNA mismatch repair endonuclease MutL n=1 Tax=Gemmatimonas sp. TaxID=1962908 RepID=UPI00356635D1